MRLETKARQASAAFPLVMKTLNQLNLSDVHNEYRLLKPQLSTDIRILEGIAVNLHVSRQILNLAGRYNYIKYVTGYIQDTMIPYYKSHLSIAPLPRQPAPIFTCNAATAVDIEKLNYSNAVLVKKGTMLAINHEVVVDKEILKREGVQLNKATKLQGRTKKMVHIPVKEFTEDTLKAITASIRGEVGQTIDVISIEQTPDVISDGQTPDILSDWVSASRPRSKTTNNSPTTQADEETPVDNLTPPSENLQIPEEPAQQTQDECELENTDTCEATSSSCFMQKLITRKGRKRARVDINVLMPLPVESTVDNIACGVCRKRGTSGRIWVQCEKCDTWYHSSCKGLSSRVVQSTHFQNRKWMCC